MKRLYAPWRTDYTEDTAHTKNEHALKEDCVFCTHIAENTDDNHYIIRRFKHNYVMLNRFPYNAGHLLIIPYEHYTFIDELDKKARIEMMELATIATSILKKELNAQGINIGLNLGKAAGAGIPAHLHLHALPRWIGDTNFLPTLAETKTVSVDLNTLFKKLKPAFKAVEL